MSHDVGLRRDPGSPARDRDPNRRVQELLAQRRGVGPSSDKHPCV